MAETRTCPDCGTKWVSADESHAWTCDVCGAEIPKPLRCKCRRKCEECVTNTDPLGERLLRRRGGNALMTRGEKPILFNGEMVRAILAGRKTQTRRLPKSQPPRDAVICGPEWFTPTIVDKDGEEKPGEPVYGFYSDDGEWGIKCPYQPGDILWVRETWQKCGTTYIYRADKENRGSAAYYNEYANLNKGWRPSIHMPREAARLFLRVVNVRAERLQDITESDAKAEGCDANIPDGMPSAVAWFHEVWERLNAKRGYGWEVNPWVFVYTFEVIDDAN